MNNSDIDSQLDLILHRRRQLKNQRRSKIIQSCWRTLAIASLGVGLIWTANQPEWLIHQPSQVRVEGNRLLSTEAIRSLLPLSYPQSLIRLQPELITQALERNASVNKAIVTRQLFPPSVTIEVQERNPVAITKCDRCTLTPKVGQTKLAQQGPATTWLLDSQGVTLPVESYPSIQNAGKLPTLTVLGFLQPSASHGQPSASLSQQKQAQWQSLYRVLSQSPVKVYQVNWQDPNDLTLKTELGLVRIGAYSAQFINQMQALDQMRKLPQHVNAKQVAYIDLKNPKQPLVQMQSKPEK